MTQSTLRRPFAASSSNCWTTPPLPLLQAVPFQLFQLFQLLPLRQGGSSLALYTSPTTSISPGSDDLYSSSTPVLNMTARPLSHILRSRCLLRKPQSAHNFSTRSSLRAADHGDHYDPPTGWLFGVKPGHKYVKEGWEGIWYYGFIGSLLVTGVAYVFKPDTS